MAIAWATLLVIGILLPGAGFLVGLTARERYSRDILRTNAVGDVAAALVASLVLHLISITLITQLGFNIRGFVRGLALLNGPSGLAGHPDFLLKWLTRIVLYAIATATIGFVAGIAIANSVASGPLRGLATHRWVYDVLRFSAGRHGIVTAYVLTRTVENERALMYKGRLSEFFLGADGEIAYVVLQHPRRFFMQFAGDAPLTTEQVSIFDGARREENQPDWNYLFLPGDQIANILFDRSPPIHASPADETKLNRALDDRRHG